MARNKGRRRFGWVRKLPSGRVQASYLGPDGKRRNAPNTFATETDADKYLVNVESLIMRDEWTDPLRGRIKFGDYAAVWIAERPGLRTRTIELYRWLLNKHINPYLGEIELGKLKTPLIRQWRAERMAAGVSEIGAGQVLPAHACRAQHRCRGGQDSVAQSVQGAWRG